MKTTTVLLIVLGIVAILIAAFFIFRSSASAGGFAGGAEAPASGSNAWDFFGRVVDSIAPTTRAFSDAFGGDTPSSESRLSDKENESALRSMGLIA